MKEKKSLDQVYNELIGPLTRYAEKHLYRKEDAKDAAHDAFVKGLDYVGKHPDGILSKFILFREVARACRRLNKTSREIATEESAFQAIENQNERKKIGRILPHSTSMGGDNETY